MLKPHKLLNLAVLLGLVYLAALLGVALFRFSYPFEIEWMEGGMITHAARLLDGDPIYAKPSTDFIPFFYTPGYPVTLAALAKVFGGLGFSLARGVSILATLFALLVTFRVGQREAGWRYGLLAVGIYAALFRTNGAFYDLARPDALFMALLSAAVYVAYYRQSAAGAVAAALLFTLGFFTKQTVSVFIPPIALYLLWRQWRHGLLFLGVVGAAIPLGIYWLTQATDGWFWTFIFEGHQGHVFHWKNILLEYWRDLLFLAPILLLVPLLTFSYQIPVISLSVFLLAHWTYAFIFRMQGFGDFPHMYYRELYYLEPRWLLAVSPALIALSLLAFRLRNPRVEIKNRGFWLLMFVAGAGASGLNHSTQWAYSNCFMLISLFAALYIAIGLKDLMAEGLRWRALVPVAVLIQLVALAYNPSQQIPQKRDYEAYAKLDGKLGQISGKILMPAHPLYGWLRDGETHVHQMGIQDVAYMKGVADLFPRLRKKEWAAVIVDSRNRVPGLNNGYYVGEQLRYADKEALLPKTGFLVRPTTIWYAQDPQPRALVEGVSANFEEGAWLGWTAEGEAFEAGPSSARIAGRQGKRLVSSRHKKRAEGKLRSAPFKLEAPEISMLLAGQGGRQRRWVGLIVGGKRVAQVWGPSGRRAHLRRVSLDVSRWVGQEVVVEIADEDPRGYIIVDDLRLVL